MKLTLFSVTLLSALLPLAAAHGFVSKVVIGGTTYKGNAPGASAKASPIRQISTTDPVKGATNKNINCGQNAKAASLVAAANPGDTMSFTWDAGDGSHWPHNTGPMFAYLAKCEGTTCDKFDSSNAKWFKIEQEGQKSNSATWFQQDIFNGGTFSTTIPDNLAPGDYLVRHEIIGLHLADVVGGAEYYPSCTQIRVGGSGTGAPSSTVSFPGAYKDTDPGLVGDNFFSVLGSKYKFPGPAVDSLSATASDSGDAAPSSASAGSSTKAPSSTKTSAPSSTKTSAPSATKTTTRSAKQTQCKIKKRAVTVTVTATPTPTASPSTNETVVIQRRHVEHPHRISRIMRSLYSH